MSDLAKIGRDTSKFLFLLWPTEIRTAGVRKGWAQINWQLNFITFLYVGKPDNIVQ